MSKNQVCLFFYVRGEFLIHGCALEEAENYGDFLVYPQSHFEIWDQYYYDKYGVDFDFFPRGRVAYSRMENKFWVYSDHCIEECVRQLIDTCYDRDVVWSYDEHYQCYLCNQNYVI